MPNHDWLSLTDISGLLVSEPVLHERYPDGPPTLSQRMQRRFRTEYERWIATQDRNRWTNFVLHQVLGYDDPRLLSERSFPSGVVVQLTDYMQTLKPCRVLVDDEGKPALLVY